MLIERNRLHSLRGRGPSSVTATVTTDVRVDEAPESPGDEDSAETWAVLKNVVVLLVAMWAGSYVSAGFSALGITLPAYIGAMLVAAAIRNLDDATGWLGLSMRVLDTIGAVALSLFLVLALMNLKLWELSSLALAVAGEPGRAAGADCCERAAGVPLDGSRLRIRGDDRWLHRLHAGHHRQCHGGDARTGGALRRRAARLPGGADGGARSSSTSPMRC